MNAQLKNGWIIFLRCKAQQKHRQGWHDADHSVEKQILWDC